jgi:putative PIN family toxin of toxin-antitoxin system
MPNKIRVFLDASVLFAAAYSDHGSARDLLRLAIAGRVEAIVSQDVLDEVERNLGRKAPAVAEQYRRLIAIVGVTVIADPTREEVRAAEAYVAQKDAMIVAAAIQAAPDYLVTYDRRHLLEPAEVAEKSGLRIVTPDVVVGAIEGSGDEDENGS